jgi:predicted TIM-barrel fold metal-dependent hydrolase
MKPPCVNSAFIRSGFNRRQFLGAAVPAVAGLTLSGCFSPRVGKQTIVDTHTHFYDPSRPQGVPWPPSSHKLLYRTVLPSDYLALPTPRRVTGTVVVEASPWLEDNQWVLDLASNDPFIVGFVGNLPIGTPEFADGLRRFAANPIFRGIRIRDRKLSGSLADPVFFGDLKRLADCDLSLDLVGGREILSYADELARQLPGLRIVIDHLAGLAVNGKPPPADWVEPTRALVRRSNVYFKVSGLVEGTGKSDGSAPEDVEFYRPVLDAMHGMFGSKRLIYASNWPVSGMFAPLTTVQGVVEAYFRSHGRSAMEQVFHLSGKSAYRWVSREPSSK